MNLLKIFFTFWIICFSFLSTNKLFSNTLFGGIEIGSKGIKVTVIDVENARKKLFVLKEFWTDNVGIAKGIAIDGYLLDEDIDAASQVVLKDYLKLLNEFKIQNKNIFIVASSGVGMAKNTDELITKIKELTEKNLEIISSKLEAKLLFNGSVAKRLQPNSLLIDIGGGYTKGGYIEQQNDGNNNFIPLNIDFGTITLTEKINKSIKTDSEITAFSDALYDYNSILSTDIKKLYTEKPEYKNKKNIFLSGGAVWAFFTLSGKLSTDNFSELVIDDVKYYDLILKNDFKKIQTLSKTNLDLEKVLKTYSYKHLLAANTILLACLNGLENLETKKIYFVRNGQIAWLLSYVADAANGSKVIY